MLIENLLCIFLDFRLQKYCYYIHYMGENILQRVENDNFSPL